MSLWKRLKAWLGLEVHDPWTGEQIEQAERLRQAGEMHKVDETTDRPIGHRLTNPLVAYGDRLSPKQIDDEIKRLDEIASQFLEQSPPPVIKMPEPVRQESTQEWVTEQLRKGGRPLAGRWANDLTSMGDADRIDVSIRTQGSTYFATGYSMRYLNRLTRRAERRDKTLTLDELMVIRSRGLV